MWNTPDRELLYKIPRLYETETIPSGDKLIYLHYFIGGCDWFIAEYDGDDFFFGFAILNSDFEMVEWGYISFAELQSINVHGIEIDCETDWTPKKFPVTVLRTFVSHYTRWRYLPDVCLTHPGFHTVNQFLKFPQKKPHMILNLLNITIFVLSFSSLCFGELNEVDRNKSPKRVLMHQNTAHVYQRVLIGWQVVWHSCQEYHTLWVRHAKARSLQNL